MLQEAAAYSDVIKPIAKQSNYSLSWREQTKGGLRMDDGLKTDERRKRRQRDQKQTIPMPVK